MDDNTAEKQKKQEITFENSLKSQDTEEWWDIHFNSPIGFFWAKCAMVLHITPNMITIASIFIGAFGGFLFYYNNLKLNIIGMLLLTLANTFDSADGQLARLTNNKTQLGRILDGLAGDVWFIVIYIVICVRLVHFNHFNAWGVWSFGVLAGASHILAASMADYYRNVHLRLIKGKKGSEHDNSQDIEKQFSETKFKEKPFQKISLWFYKNYTKQQEKLSPKLQQFKNHLNEKFGDNIPEGLLLKIGQENKKYMPLTNILQFNIRVMFLFFSLLINKVWLYFVFDVVVMNLILSYLIIKEEQLFYFYDKYIRENNINNDKSK